MLSGTSRKESAWVRVGFLIHRETAGNVEDFFSVKERVGAVVIKLNQLYRLKRIQVYAPTASYGDDDIDSIYEDVETAMNKGTAQFTIVAGDFNAKVDAKRVGEKSAGNFEIGTLNCRGNTLVGFEREITSN